MKKIIIALLLFMTGVANAQKLSGSWIGELKVGPQSLNLVLHISDDNKCLMDSPDQGVKGIPTEINFISADSISLSVPMIGMTYRGKLADGKIKGTFMQSGFTAQLNLKQGEIKRNRPQNPVAPLPYSTEEVSFSNTSAGAVLAGTLTYPVDYSAGSKVPVVLMVTGSGLENRDEEVFDHKPFLVIADFLARKGIATLRYDDRGFAKSTGDASKATTIDFADDALAGIEFLRKTAKFSAVGILGHSEGGNIAFILGAQKKVDFVISMAGVGVKADEALTAQANRISELMGRPQNLTIAQYRMNAAMAGSPWLNYFIDYDPTTDIRNTTCPVMAINGNKDVQVISELNLHNIKKILPANTKNMVKEYVGLNHLFQYCQTGLTTEYASIEQTISPEVLADMAAWIGDLQ